MEIILKGIKSSLDCVLSNMKDLFVFKKNSRKYSFHISCDAIAVQLEFKKYKAQRIDYGMAVGPSVALPPPFMISLFGQELIQKSFKAQGSPNPGETTVSDEQKRP
jgi:hypothetical protein